MRALLLVPLMMIAVPDRPDPAPKEKAKPLQEQVLGEWRLVKSTVGGREDNEKAGTLLVVTSTELHIHEKGERNPGEDASYRLDADKKPAAIDLVPKRDGNQKIEGILRVEGDTLTLCFPHAGRGSRPTEFVSPNNSQVALMQFQRVKK